MLGVEIRHPGQGLAPAVEEKLPDIRLVQAECLEVALPRLVPIRLPPTHRPAAAEHHLLARAGLVGNGRLGRARILRTKGQRLRKIVGSTTNHDLDRPLRVELGLAHGVARPGQRGEGLVLAARIGVVARRRHVELVGRHRRPNSDNQQ